MKQHMLLKQKTCPVCEKYKDKNAGLLTIYDTWPQHKDEPILITQ